MSRTKKGEPEGMNTADAQGHTPGPWVQDWAPEWPSERPEGWETVCNVEPDAPDEPGSVVAYCHPKNARLIARAPDLLRERDELLEARNQAERDFEEETAALRAQLADALDALKGLVKAFAPFERQLAESFEGSVEMPAMTRARSLLERAEG